MHGMYWQARAKQIESGGQGSISDYFRNLSANPNEVAMHDYVEMITMKSLLIAIVEDPYCCSFSKHNAKFGVK